MAAHVLYHDSSHSRARLASIGKYTFAVVVLFSLAAEVGQHVRPGVVQTTKRPLLTLTADAYGQWRVDGKANGVPLPDMIVDTGAFGILLPYDAALKMNLRQKLVFDSPSMSANGPMMAARITLREFSFGNIKLHNVEARVAKNADMTLVGMSVLRTHEFHAKDGVLSIW